MLLGWIAAAHAAPCEGFEALVLEAGIDAAAGCDRVGSEWSVVIGGRPARLPVPADREARDETVLLFRSLATAPGELEEPAWPSSSGADAPAAPPPAPAPTDALEPEPTPVPVAPPPPPADAASEPRGPEGSPPAAEVVTTTPRAAWRLPRTELTVGGGPRLESNEGLAGGGFGEVAMGGRRLLGSLQVGGTSWSTFEVTTPTGGGAPPTSTVVRVRRLEVAGGLRYAPVGPRVAPVLQAQVGVVNRVLEEVPTSVAPLVAGGAGLRARLAPAWSLGVEGRVAYDLLDTSVDRGRTRVELDPVGAGMVVAATWNPSRS